MHCIDVAYYYMSHSLYVGNMVELCKKTNNPIIAPTVPVGHLDPHLTQFLGPSRVSRQTAS